MIIISGMEYTVEYVQPHEIPGNAGVADYDSQRIKISNDLSGDAQSEVLLHEILHCVDVATSSLDRMTEEQVHRISRCLFSVFRDERNWSQLSCIQSAE